MIAIQSPFVRTCAFITQLAALLAGGLSLTSCAAGKEPSAYVAEFVADARLSGREVDVSRLVVRFDSLPDGVGGRCDTDENGDPEVVVSESLWPELGDMARKVVVYHELGHCVLHRAHTESRDAVGLPVSLMYPSLVPPIVFKHRQDAYLREMFSTLDESSSGPAN